MPPKAKTNTCPDCSKKCYGERCWRCEHRRRSAAAEERGKHKKCQRCGKRLKKNALKWCRPCYLLETRANGSAPEQERLDIVLPKFLMRGSFTVEELAARCKSPVEEIKPAIERLGETHNLVEKAGRWMISTGTTSALRTPLTLHTELDDLKQQVIRVGLVSDNHCGSKYSRPDELEQAYDLMARDGITTVIHCGNYIEGEDPKKTGHGLELEDDAHGFDKQIRKLCMEYPSRKGITTYFVTGMDHEGWYIKREGIDVGKAVERMAQSEYGRDDLVSVGFMEAFITLMNTKTGAQNHLLACHPGGGSAYATSYAPQKYVEALPGGTKPGAVFLGHYHKLDCNNIRNVWVLQAGCFQDQTTWARSKKLNYQVGFHRVEFVMDDAGALIECSTRVRRWFNRGYVGERWSMTGDIVRGSMDHGD